MKTKRFKIAGLIALSLVLMVVMAACDNGLLDEDENDVGEPTTYTVTVNVSPDDATVQLDGMTEPAVDGMAVFEDVEAGNYTATVSADGYPTKEEAVFVSDDDVSVSIELDADGNDGENDEDPVDETEEVADADQLFEALNAGKTNILLTSSIVVDYNVDFQDENVTLDLGGYTLSHEESYEENIDRDDDYPVILIDAENVKIKNGTISNMATVVRDGLTDPVMEDITFNELNAVILGADWFVSPKKTTLNFAGDITVPEGSQLGLFSFEEEYYLENDYAFMGNDATISGPGTLWMTEADFAGLTIDVDNVDMGDLRLGDITFTPDVDLYIWGGLVSILNNSTVTFNNDVDITEYVRFDAYLDAGALDEDYPAYRGTITGSGMFDIERPTEQVSRDVNISNGSGYLELQNRVLVDDFTITGDDVNIENGDVFFRDVNLSWGVNVAESSDSAVLHLLSDLELNTANNVLSLYDGGAVEGRKEYSVVGTSGEVALMQDNATFSAVNIYPDLFVNANDFNVAGPVETNEVNGTEDAITVTLGSHLFSSNPGVWTINENVLADDFTLAGTGSIYGQSYIFDGTDAFTVTGDIVLRNTGWTDSYDYLDVQNGANLTFEGNVDNQEVLSIAGMIHGVDSLNNTLGLNLDAYVARQSGDFEFSGVPFFIEGSTAWFNVYEDFGPITITLPEDSDVEWTNDADDEDLWPGVKSVTRVDNKTLTIVVGEPGAAWSGLIDGDYRTVDDVIRTFQYESYVIRGIEVDLGFIDADYDLELRSGTQPSGK